LSVLEFFELCLRHTLVKQLISIHRAISDPRENRLTL
jgi:hypothetical protein